MKLLVQVPPSDNLFSITNLSDAHTEGYASPLQDRDIQHSFL
jgi:hypothetical protein